MALNIAEMRPGMGYLTCCFGNPIYRKDTNEIIFPKTFITLDLWEL